MTKVDRRKAIENEHKESQQRGRGLYTYVKVNELDRLGIEQYKPATGDNFISIVCSPDEKGFYGRKVAIHQHIGVDDRTYICPQGTWGKDCPICEEVARMRKAGEDQDLINELRPSIRYLFFIIDVTNEKTEDEGLKWFDASPGIKDEIVALSVGKRDGNAIDISDPDTGKAVAFTRTGTRLKTRYKGFELEKRPPIPDDILESIPLFDEVLQEVTYEDLEKAFTGMEGGKKKRSRDDDDNPEESRGRRKRSSEQEESETRKSRDEDDEKDSQSRRRSESEDSGQSRRRSRENSDESDSSDRGSRRSRNRDEDRQESEDKKSGNRDDESEDKGRRRSRDSDEDKRESEEHEEEESSGGRKSLAERIAERKRRKQEESNEN